MRRLLIILFLISVMTLSAFGLTGTYTTNGYFYMPGYGSYGTAEFAEYNTYMQTADTQIEANKTASADENIEDTAGAMWTGNAEIGLTITYQDADGTVDAVIGADNIVETMLKFVNEPADEDIYTYEATTGDFEWHTLAELSIQPLDTALTNISALAYVSASFIKLTANDTYAVRTLSEVRTDLGLVIGTNVQAFDNALTSVSGLAYVSGSFIALTANDTYAVRTYAQTLSDIGAQASDAGLTSLAGLTYASASFIKATAEDTYAIRTITETKTDLSLNNVENTAVSAWAGSANITTLGTIGTGTWQGTAIADTYIPNTITISDLQVELDAGAHSIGFTQQTVTYNVTTTTVNWTAGNKATVTLTGNVGTFAFTNPSNPCNVLLKIVQDATGSRVVTAWDADIKWVGGTAPTLTTTANGIDIISGYWDGTNYFCVASLAFATP